MTSILLVLMLITIGMNISMFVILYKKLHDIDEEILNMEFWQNIPHNKRD